MAGVIKFSEASHWYSKEGQSRHEADLRTARKEGLYPSVTSLDKKCFVNEFLDKWKMEQFAEAASNNHRMPHESAEEYSNRIYQLSLEYAKQAAVFGDRLHKAIELFPQPCEAELVPWQDRYRKWHEENVIETVASEKVVVDSDIGVAGRTDRIVLHKKYGLTVVDYKSQNVKKSDKGVKQPAFYDSWCRQLSFYGVSFAKETKSFPGSIPTAISLIFDSNEPEDPFEKVWTKEELAYAYDCLLAGIWQWFAGNTKRKAFWPTGTPWHIFDSPPPRITI